MFEEIKNIKTRKKDLKSFGVTMGIIFLVIGGLLFFKEKEYYTELISLAGIFIGLGYIFPIPLKPIYFIWMVFAVIMGWIMTRVILSLIFYLIISPIGFLTRIFGKDFLKLKIKKHDSYWNHRDSDIEINQDYEKQF